MEIKNPRCARRKLKGVYLALDYLYRIYTSELGYLPKSVIYPTGEKVAVIGAGLTAVDAAIEAQRQGAKEVYVSTGGQ